ncbi:hypothetical protein OEG84_11640 [Hoeflea sp. G2-23]|uniref:Uncharacterized protein n=1 Tax=Hoeflea algicola TaxID=2983763 RepID=A0ABT3Z9A2_9HYPH|nr:hypothetical protein [Hoeflea algicola]MCY0148345.1 hypothetical protein [Hoeflea algicola]
MSINIHIEVPEKSVQTGDASDYLARSMAALGFYRGRTSDKGEAPVTAKDADETPEQKEDGVVVDTGFEVPVAEPGGNVFADTKQEAPTRERGKPSEGRKRRTKEEIAEDEAADAADAAAAASKPAISTGENRVGPEDDAETEAADAADEAAETESTGLAPIDQLRRAMGAYQKKFGMAEAVKLVEEGGLIGRGITDIDEADIPAAVERVNAAVAGAKTETKAAAETPTATKEDAVAAMKRYALEFDGQNTDPANMPFTMEDCPKIFGMLFGAGITKISHVPADGYGKVVAAIDEAIQKDPFKRGAE